MESKGHPLRLSQLVNLYLALEWVLLWPRGMGVSLRKIYDLKGANVCPASLNLPVPLTLACTLLALWVKGQYSADAKFEPTATFVGPQILSKCNIDKI